MTTYVHVEVDALRTEPVMVTWGQTVFWHVPMSDVQVIIGGRTLPLAADVQRWVWTVPRQLGHLVLEVVRADECVLRMLVVIYAQSPYHADITCWEDDLAKIDRRLLAPASMHMQRSWRRSDIEAAFMGRSFAEVLRMVRDILVAQQRVLRPWDGTDLPRWDRFGAVNAHPGLAMDYVEPQPVSFALSQRLLAIVRHLEPLCTNTMEGDLHRDLQARIPHTTLVRSRWAVAQLEAWVATMDSVPYFDTAPHVPHAQIDVALLYERWVWLQTLNLLLPPETIRSVVTMALDAAQTEQIVINDTFRCGYQRRIVPHPYHTGLWSRDYRTAIPDVLVWCEHPRPRVMCIDAKLQLNKHTPSQQALNDVTAYLARVGVGDNLPDAAILVHAGEGWGHYASGLWVIDRSRDAWDAWQAWIHDWMQH